MSNFTLDDVGELMRQHTQETGQNFESQVSQKVFHLTRGQPWLTNTLLQKCAWDLCPKGETITVAHIDEA